MPAAFLRILIRTLVAGCLFAILFLLLRHHTFAASSWNPTLIVNTEAFQVIDDANATANLELRFGTSLNATIKYDRTNARFDFTKSVYVHGNLTLTGALKVTSITASGGIVYMSGSQLVGNATGSSGKLLISQFQSAPKWVNPSGGMVWYLDGTQSIATSVGAQVTMPFSLTLTGVTLNIKGAPTGAALIVNVRKNGTTIFGTRPQITAGATTGGSGAVLSVTAIPINSLMTVDIDQVGSTFAGSGLTVILKGTRNY